MPVVPDPPVTVATTSLTKKKPSGRCTLSVAVYWLSEGGSSTVRTTRSSVEPTATGSAICDTSREHPLKPDVVSSSAAA